jgi:hypothetical protein
MVVGGGAFCFTNQPTKAGQVSMQRGPSPPFRLGFRSEAVVAGVLSGSCLVPLRVPVRFRNGVRLAGRGRGPRG